MVCQTYTKSCTLHRYDEAAELARVWLPELAGLPPRLRHRPWEAGVDGVPGFVPGETYPAPVVDPRGQIGETPKPAAGGGGKARRKRRQKQ